MSDCVICRGVDGDAEMLRQEVWSDDLWRLTTALVGEVAGFSYLEPRRHVRYVDELDGPEAATLGSVLARTTAAIKQATDAAQVYVYVFGDSIPHLHLHLAPHRVGDPLNGSMIKGEVTEQELPGGGVLVTSADYPPLPEPELREAADRVRSALRT
ncbi:MAG: adenylyltransferase [Nocardioidaceae bacterium]|jgi:diadenosine tetraphosphate (Ap4A) HIT family hydrolase|nr:adenylyltransferase [Nocardioidaceae bacterium]